MSRRVLEWDGNDAHKLGDVEPSHMCLEDPKPMQQMCQVATRIEVLHPIRQSREFMQSRRAYRDEVEVLRVVKTINHFHNKRVAFDFL